MDYARGSASFSPKAGVPWGVDEPENKNALIIRANHAVHYASILDYSWRQLREAQRERKSIEFFVSIASRIREVLAARKVIARAIGRSEGSRSTGLAIGKSTVRSVVHAIGPVTPSSNL
jgi:hypothetical protein